MKFSTQSIPFFLTTILLVSTSTAYADNPITQKTNGHIAQARPNRSRRIRIDGRPKPPYPKRLCRRPYFCLPYPSKKPNTVCKLYASQGPNGPFYFYRCRRVGGPIYRNPV